MRGYWAVIKGLKALDEYCLKRWKETPHFVESFAHNPCYIQRIEEIPAGGEHYEQYFILAIPDERGEWFNYNDIVIRVYKEIREGKVKLLNQ